MNNTSASVERYMMIIQWSDADHAYLVTLPEWQERLVGRVVAHGATYEDAARSGRIALELLIEDAQTDGEDLPAPRRYPATA